MSIDDADGKIVWGAKADRIIRERTRYHDGGNCMFYAVQEACGYFTGMGFDVSELQRFQMGKAAMTEVEQAYRGGETGPEGIGLAMTLAFILPYTREKFVDVKAIWMVPGEAEKMKRIDPELGKYHYEEIGDDFRIKIPCYVITESHDLEKDGHVFFVGNREELGPKIAIHMEPEDYVVAIVQLERAKEL